MTHKGCVKIHYEQMFDGVIAETIAAQFWQNSDIMTTWGSDVEVSLLFLLSEEQWQGGGRGAAISQKRTEVEVWWGKKKSNTNM